MSKIIQIAACGVDENAWTQCEAIFLALTDDGRILQGNNRNDEWTDITPPSQKPGRKE